MSECSFFFLIVYQLNWFSDRLPVSFLIFSKWFGLRRDLAVTRGRAGFSLESPMIVVILNSLIDLFIILSVCIFVALKPVLRHSTFLNRFQMELRRGDNHLMEHLELDNNLHIFTFLNGVQEFLKLNTQII